MRRVRPGAPWARPTRPGRRRGRQGRQGPRGTPQICRRRKHPTRAATPHLAGLPAKGSPQSRTLQKPHSALQRYIFPHLAMPCPSMTSHQVLRKRSLARGGEGPLFSLTASRAREANAAPSWWPWRRRGAGLGDLWGVLGRVRPRMDHSAPRHAGRGPRRAGRSGAAAEAPPQRTGKRAGEPRRGRPAGEGNSYRPSGTPSRAPSWAPSSRRNRRPGAVVGQGCVRFESLPPSFASVDRDGAGRTKDRRECSPLGGQE